MSQATDEQRALEAGRDAACGRCGVELDADDLNEAGHCYWCQDEPCERCGCPCSPEGFGAVNENMCRACDEATEALDEAEAEEEEAADALTEALEALREAQEAAQEALRAHDRAKARKAEVTAKYGK